MLKVKETTFDVAHYNHMYFLSNDKMQCHGYQPASASVPTMFDPPLKFNPKRRTFVKVK